MEQNMHYEVAQQTIKRNNSNAKIYELDLQLTKFPIPERLAKRHFIKGPLSSVLAQIRTHASAITGITVEQCEDPTFDEAQVTAEYLTGTCPYCGTSSALDNNSWRVVVKYDWSGPKPLIYEYPSKDSAGKRPRYAALPADLLDFNTLTLTGIADLRTVSEDLKTDISKPYGDEPPFPQLEFLLTQTPLPFDKSWPTARKVTLGAPESEYMGICECQHCEGLWYAYTENLWPFVDNSNSLQQQFMQAQHIKATVSADKRFVRIDFDRNIGNGGPSHLSFDTLGGIFEVDGVQGFKTQRGTKLCLQELDYSFECPRLFDIVGELLFERVQSFDSAVTTLLTRRAALGGQWTKDGLCIVDYAIANRFRNYPIAFYNESYKATSKSCIRGVRFSEGLPVHYCDVLAAYEACGLPNVKSIRRLAFAQPWIISYATYFTRLPFKDVNLLRAFLSGERALHNAELAADEVSHSIFEYVKKTRGELAAWKMIRCLNTGHSSVNLQDVFNLYCAGETTFQSERTPLDFMPLKEALNILVCLCNATHNESRWHESISHLFLNYSYTKEMVALQSVYRNVKFCLPETGMDLLKAETKLHNCLSSYIVDQGASSLVLTMQRSEKLVGAIEVDICERKVLQALGPCNVNLTEDKAIFEAFKEWAESNKLEYQEAC